MWNLMRGTRGTEEKMPRSPKCRKICCYPDYLSFVPENRPEGVPGEQPKPLDTVVMSLDEFETIRLLDAQGLNQQDAAAQMGVARTTVTAIYDSARKKLAMALVNGSRLVISGGHVTLNLENMTELADLPEKGGNTLRVAATYENGMIFQHFGHTQEFKVYDIENGAIVNEQVMGSNGTGHGALAGLLKSGGVDALICGGIGGGAQMALAEAGVQLYAGVSGSADEAVKALVAGTLQYSTSANCDHHGHGEGHSCGNHEGAHSCGSHSCGNH